LLADEVPERIVSMLDPLKDREFETREVFLGELSKIVDADDLKSFQDRALKHALISDRYYQESWREFLEIYQGFLIGIVRRCAAGMNPGTDDQEVEDIVQIVLLKVLKKSASWEPSRGKFRSWLAAIAKNAAIDHYRKPNPQLVIPAILDAVPAPADLEQLEKDVASYVLKRVKEKYEADSTKWRCFEERFLKKRPAKEIAKELRGSVSDVYSNTHRVLKEVRQMCREYMEE